MTKEKRKFARAWFLCKITAIFGERLLVLDSHAHNLSPGGVRVVLNEKLHVGTPVELELFIAGEGNPFKCKGEVRWIREIGPIDKAPRLVDTGIEFTEVLPADREALSRFVNNAILREEEFKS